MYSQKPSNSEKEDHMVKLENVTIYNFTLSLIFVSPAEIKKFPKSKFTGWVQKNKAPIVLKSESF